MLILVLGLVAAVSAVLTAAISFTSLDPPTWTRILMTSGIPVGVIGAPLVWVLSPDARREAVAWIGLALVAVTLAAFVVMLNAGY